MSTVIERPMPGPVDLTGALEALYEAFGRYAYRASMPACAHCVSDDDLLALGRQPLAQLPPPLLGRYTIKAVSTWGEVRDFKWLLPRLAELLARGQLPVPADALTAKLKRASWHDWPEAEHLAIRGFLHAWWHDGLCGEPEAAEVVKGRLPAVAAAESDLTHYLTHWHSCLGCDDKPLRLTALAHVRELVCHSRFRPDVPATLERLFWEPAGPAAAQTSAWLTSPDLAEELDRALYELADTPGARHLAVVAARLRRYRAALGF